MEALGAGVSMIELSTASPGSKADGGWLTSELLQILQDEGMAGGR